MKEGPDNAILIKIKENFNLNAIVKDHFFILEWKFKPYLLSEFEKIILPERGGKCRN